MIGPAIAAGLLPLASQAGAAADGGRGPQLAAVCASCHGHNGGAKGIPVIIGLDAGRISRAMLAYRASERPSHIMHAIALSLSDEEIASVARYLAAKVKKAEPP